MNLEYHPRILAFYTSSTTPKSASSTPGAQTPATQSRRPSYDAIGHLASEQEKTNKTLNQSIKKMWKEVKRAANEHHRSVNNAYEATHGAGIRMRSANGN